MSHNIVKRMLMYFTGLFVMTIGIAVSDVSGIAFPKVKIGFDVSMVVVSLITCLIFIKSLGSVGVGTIIAALLVGMELGYITKHFGDLRDKWLELERNT